MYMLNFMCNYENQYIFIRTFLSLLMSSLFLSQFLLLFTLFTSFSKFIYSCRDNTMIGKCGKKSAKINLSKTWLLILSFEVFGAGYLSDLPCTLRTNAHGCQFGQRITLMPI